MVVGRIGKIKMNMMMSTILRRRMVGEDMFRLKSGEARWMGNSNKVQRRGLTGSAGGGDREGKKEKKEEGKKGEEEVIEKKKEEEKAKEITQPMEEGGKSKEEREKEVDKGMKREKEKETGILDFLDRENFDQLKERLLLSSKELKKSLLTTTEPLRTIQWSNLKQNPTEFIKSAASSINQVTGYNEIENLKLEINNKSTEFQTAKEQLKLAKERYQTCIEARAKGQRDINNLLQRKHAWSDEDLNQFTQLYRSEHQHESYELATKEETKRLEDLVDTKYDQLIAAIRNRYQEEQLWSDKIRGASTYWTLALILLNMVMFLSVHTIFEPRKRHKLIEKVQENLLDSLQTERANFQTVTDNLTQQYQHQEAILSDLSSKLGQLNLHPSSHPHPDSSPPPLSYNEEQLSALLNELLHSQSTDQPPPPPPPSLPSPIPNPLQDPQDPNLYLVIGSAVTGFLLSSLLSLALSR